MTRVQFPLRAAHHPTKVLIPLSVGELVAAKLRIYRRQALATGRPILYQSHQPWPNVASRQRARGADPATLRDNRLADTAKAAQTLKKKKKNVAFCDTREHSII
uniref:Uncharacterized protein n=1 Tax=Plectus sambesii TaxID=2011161 RepID=A0A914WLP8_9BILA